MAIDVFFSVGKASTPQQEEFIKSMEQFLRTSGLNPRAVDRTDFSSRQPLELIVRLMRECSGSVILAFERLHVANGMDRRQSKDEKPITDQAVTTVWNQIEGGMAYIVGHPLLVIAEHGLRSEGLIEGKYDWNLQWVDLSPAEFAKPKFVGVFSDWRRRVEDYGSRRRQTQENGVSLDPGKLTIGQIIRGLKPAQLWAICGSLIATLVAAFKLGTLFK